MEQHDDWLATPRRDLPPGVSGGPRAAVLRGGLTPSRPGPARAASAQRPGAVPHGAGRRAGEATGAADRRDHAHRPDAQPTAPDGEKGGGGRGPRQASRRRRDSRDGKKLRRRRARDEAAVKTLGGRGGATGGQIPPLRRGGGGPERHAGADPKAPTLPHRRPLDAVDPAGDTGVRDRGGVLAPSHGPCRPLSRTVRVCPQRQPAGGPSSPSRAGGRGTRLLLPPRTC